MASAGGEKIDEQPESYLQANGKPSLHPGQAPVKLSSPVGLSVSSAAHLPSSSASSSSPRKLTKVQIILIGDSGVGKTTFLRKFAIVDKKNVIDAHMDSVTRSMSFGDKKVAVQLIDTGGQERYRTLTASYYRNATGVLLFFNYDNPHSFAQLPTWLSDIKHYCNRINVDVVLVGLASKDPPRLEQLQAELNQNSPSDYDCDVIDAAGLQRVASDSVLDVTGGDPAGSPKRPNGWKGSQLARAASFKASGRKYKSLDHSSTDFLNHDVVTADKATKFAEHHKLLFVEVSNKPDTVDEAVGSLVEQVLRRACQQRKPAPETIRPQDGRVSEKENKCKCCPC